VRVACCLLIFLCMTIKEDKDREGCLLPFSIFVHDY